IRLSQQEQIELFTHNWTSLTGKVWVVSAAEAAEAIPTLVRQVCADLQIDRVTRWDHPDLQALPLDAALAAAGIDVVPWRADDHVQAAAAEHNAAVAPHAAEAAPPALSRWSSRSPLLQA